MAILIYGPRAASAGALRPGCGAAIFDETRTRLLLTRRADNGQWCLPGGGMDAGETLEECCAREIWEETGLEIEVGRLLLVDSDPDRLVTYPDGNAFHVIVLLYQATVTGGTPIVSDETTAIDFFTWDEIQTMDLLADNWRRVEVAFFPQEEIVYF